VTCTHVSRPETDTSAGLKLESPFYYPVFQAVEGYDQKAPAYRQPAYGFGTEFPQAFQLTVDSNP
jgi:hypothetical protein